MLKSRLQFIGLAFAALAISVMAYAGSAKDAPKNVSLDACKAKKPAVAFDHAKHASTLKLACDKCHHTQKGLKEGAADEVKKCAACHLKPEKPTTPACTEMSPSKNPFHIACIKCHKTEKKGPTKCAECHK